MTDREKELQKENIKLKKKLDEYIKALSFVLAPTSEKPCRCYYPHTGPECGDDCIVKEAQAITFFNKNNFTITDVRVGKEVYRKLFELDLSKESFSVDFNVDGTVKNIKVE